MNYLGITIKKNLFLFQELTKRDFKAKYKRTILGMAWSILSPLFTLLVMKLVFSNYFGASIPHYTIYLFCGNLLFAYFRESTQGGMYALLNNSHIFSKINIPKYMFLLTKNISSLINFLLSFLLFLMFVFLDNISFNIKFIFLIFPISCIIIFNIGMGLILSALLVFFRDIGYLYEIFTILLMYMSAIFYDVTIVPREYVDFFYLNPIFNYINYFRKIILYNEVPSMSEHILCLAYAIAVMYIGITIYKKYNHKFLYYI